MKNLNKHLVTGYWVWLSLFAMSTVTHIIGFFIGDQSLVLLANILIWISSGAVLVQLILDYKLLNRGDRPSMWWTLLFPVYLWKRSTHIFWAWSILVLVNISFVGYLVYLINKYN